MLRKFKFTAIKLFNNQNARALLILGIVVLATLIAGAPQGSGG